MEWLNWLDKEDKYSGMTAKQRKIQESIDNEKDSDNQYYTKAWEAWLEKDALDGKGANDKIKDPKWTNEVGRKTTKELTVTPKKFLDNAYGKESGEKTNLMDAHSNEDMPNHYGDSRHKIGHNPIMGKKEDNRSSDERGIDSYTPIERGDELGDVESKKRKLRRGESMQKPKLTVDTKGKVIDHDGRHRARAAMEEGHETIPIEVHTYDNKHRGRRHHSYARNNINDLTPESGRRKSWEAWLEKDDRWDKEPQQTKGHGITSPKKTRAIATQVKEEGKRGDNFNDDNELTLDMNDRATREGLDTQYVNHSPEPKFTLKQPKFRKGVANQNYPKSEQPEQDEMNIELAHESKSWESWLKKESTPEPEPERDYLAEMKTLGEQNMYQNSSKKKKFLKEAKGAGKKIKQQMGENNLPLSYSNRLRTNIKRPKERVTSNDLSDLDGWLEENKSWESWLDKNNAIETSHKEDEKKEEWDGKFSSSTIRDDVENDDDKAVSEEESLEELTDGKLEEIEKLKSWESWLEKGRWDEPKSTATDTHLKEESGRDTRVEVNELNAEIGQEATNERLDEAGRTGMFKPTDTPNFTSKKPKYVKGVEQTGDDISQSKEHLNIDIAHAAKSWEGWLEKMQGAGDARFGNQHLTGLDQKPVNNEEDEPNILPEKDEKTDDKEEKQEETDNKPYKALDVK